VKLLKFWQNFAKTFGETFGNISPPLWAISLSPKNPMRSNIFNFVNILKLQFFPQFPKLWQNFGKIQSLWPKFSLIFRRNIDEIFSATSSQHYLYRIISVEVLLKFWIFVAKFWKDSIFGVKIFAKLSLKYWRNFWCRNTNWAVPGIVWVHSNYCSNFFMVYQCYCYHRLFNSSTNTLLVLDYYFIISLNSQLTFDLLFLVVTCFKLLA